MTSDEFATSNDLQEMLEILQTLNVSDRKFRLFACACCRQVWSLLTDVRSQKAVETAELYTDNLVTSDDLNAAESATRSAAWSAARKFQTDLLRDIFGNPFCSTLNMYRSTLWTWTPMIESLAEAAYENRLLPSGQLDPFHLNMLADALEERNVDQEIVDHLRSSCFHVKGMWSLDLVLGKE